jgi:putative transcriptional regulator
MMNLTGKLLIAPPSVKGNFWYKTVILITEHHNNGSLGLVLNKRSQMTVREFSEQCGHEAEYSNYLYLGGPVNVKALSMLHSADWSCSNTMRVTDNLAISSAEDLLPKMAMGYCPTQWRMFMGLCGWAPGQLENEIKGNPPFHHNTSWLIANPDYSLIFDNDLKEQWTHAVDRSGQEFAHSILT